MNTLLGLGDEAIDEQERFTIPFSLVHQTPAAATYAAWQPVSRPPMRPLWLVLCDAVELVANELIARASFSVQFFGRHA